MPINAWQELLAYQSGDLIRLAYRRQHSRELNLCRARQIRAHFLQAAGYFQSSRDASIVAKPLILYYGCLAMARGLILFHSNIDEAALLKKHGVGSYGWDNVFSKGNKRILDLTVTIEEGTFTQLMHATKNRNYLSPPGRCKSKTFWQSYVSITAGYKLSLKDIISRIPTLKETYEKTLGFASDCLHADFSCLYEDNENKVKLMVAIYDHHIDRLLNPNIVLNKIARIERVERTQASGRGFELSWVISMAEDNDAPASIASAQHSPGWANYNSLVIPFDDGKMLSQLGLVFLTAYSLSMLVRYHASAWTALLYEGSQDMALPLLRAAVDHVESEFPELVLNSLSGKQNF
jgi:hypothetical protein